MELTFWLRRQLLTFVQKMTTERTAALDGVRGLAVLIVLLSHTSGRDQQLLPFLDFKGIGHTGVYLFFVLSGYLLTNNLLHEYEAHQKVSLSRYFVRRFFRIAPLYYVVLSYVFMTQVINGNLKHQYLHIQDGFTGYMKHLIFYKGDSVFWTIPTEVFFYLLIPASFIMYIKYQFRWLLILSLTAVFFSMWTLVSIANIYEDIPNPKIVDIKHGSQFLEVFIVGSLFAFLSRHASLYKWITSYSGRFVTSMSLAILMLLTILLVSKKFFYFEMPYYEFRWFSMLYAIIFGMTVIACQEKGGLNKFFTNKLLVTTGVLGFSIYLIHFEVIRIVNVLNVISPFKLAISLPLIYLVAYLTYKIIEKPFINFSKGFFPVRVSNKPVKTNKKAAG